MKRRAAYGFLMLSAIILLPSAGVRADFRHARPGPRPRAMGSAFVSVVSDANAVYWNPSGMTQLARFEITGCRTMLWAVDGLANDYVAAVYNWGRIAAFGLSWVRLGLKDIYNEDTINLAVAREMPFLEGLSIGGSFKMFYLSAPGYEQYNDPAYEGRQVKSTFDLGIHYRASEPWTFGAIIYNVTQPELQLLSTTRKPDPVHMNLAFGASYTFYGQLLLTFDVRTRYGEIDNTIGRLGSELWFFDAVALRGGFEKENLTAGIGLKGKSWEVDIMMETHYDLGNTYQFGATIRL